MVSYHSRYIAFQILSQKNQSRIGKKVWSHISAPGSVWTTRSSIADCWLGKDGFAPLLLVFPLFSLWDAYWYR